MARKRSERAAAAAPPTDESTLLLCLKDRRITEVECLVPDMTGNARGKIIPAAKFSHDYGTRLPEGIFVTTVTGDYPDEYSELVRPSDSDMFLRPDTWFLPLTSQLMLGGGFGITVREAKRDELEELRRASLDYYAALRSASLQSREQRVREARER